MLAAIFFVVGSLSVLSLGAWLTYQDDQKRKEKQQWNSEIRKSSGTSPHPSSSPFSQTATFQTASQQLYQRMTQSQAAALQLFYATSGLTSIPPESQPKPTVRQEIAATPIVGWRLWNIEVGTASDETMTRTQLAARGTAVALTAVSPLHDVATGTSMPHLLLALADKIESGQDIAQALRAMVKVRLLSANQEPWEKGRAARCGIHGQSHGDHIQPDPKCACGYWALRSREAVHHRFFGGFRAGGPCAIGTVELWGKVIEHEHGWRGEYARPKQITVYNTEQWVADAIAREWECEVTRA